MSARAITQSIGPDGRVLPAFSGHVANPPPPAVNAPVAPPAIIAPIAPPAVIVPIAPPAVIAPITPPAVIAPVANALVANPSIATARVADSHVLNDSEVAAAIEKGSREQPHAIGLTLLDIQTALLSGMTCKTCGQSGYTVVIYTPVKWIEFQAALAKRQLRPFAFANVTPEMRDPILRVLALPSKADYITGQGLSLSSSVSRVVLTDKTKNTIIQPLTNEQGNVESNSAFRSVNYTSASASFSLTDVDTIRGEDDKGEFFVVVVGSNQNKYFKVKTRMFKSLF